MAEALAEQLGTSVRAVFGSLASYLALLVRNNPKGTVRQLFARPDVEAIITGVLDEARDQAQAAVMSAWGDEDGPARHRVLEHLLNDVEHAYSPRWLRHLIRQGYLSVITEHFLPGVSTPGSNPVKESAERRAAAVTDAVNSFAAQALHRNQLSIDAAAGFARTEALLEQARAGGEQVWKRWRAHIDSPVCCHWCRKLNGVTIPLHESFVLHVGPAVDLTGHGHRTRPPRPYKGHLQGPQLHPHCQCWLEIVPAPGASDVPPEDSQAGQRPPVPAAGYLAAAEIRAMPEEKYRSLVTFLRAATHELGNLLRRLAGRGD